jgi:hypothetical protein
MVEAGGAAGVGVPGGAAVALAVGTVAAGGGLLAGVVATIGVTVTAALVAGAGLAVAAVVVIPEGACLAVGVLDGSGCCRVGVRVDSLGVGWQAVTIRRSSASMSGPPRSPALRRHAPAMPPPLLLTSGSALGIPHGVARLPFRTPHSAFRIRLSPS